MKIKDLTHKHIAIIAVTIAAIFLVYWVFSGRLNLNQNLRQIQNDPKTDQVEIVESVDGQKSAQVKCQDGSSYDIYYPEGSTDFQSLQNSKCQ